MKNHCLSTLPSLVRTSVILDQTIELFDNFKSIMSAVASEDGGAVKRHGYKLRLGSMCVFIRVIVLTEVLF